MWSFHFISNALNPTDHKILFQQKNNKTLVTYLSLLWSLLDTILTVFYIYFPHRIIHLYSNMTADLLTLVNGLQLISKKWRKLVDKYLGLCSVTRTMEYFKSNLKRSSHFVHRFVPWIGVKATSWSKPRGTQSSNYI